MRPCGVSKEPYPRCEAFHCAGSASLEASVLSGCKYFIAEMLPGDTGEGVGKAGQGIGRSQARVLSQAESCEA